MAKRRRHVPDGVEQLCLFPGDVALKPHRQSDGSSSSRPSCLEGGHTWARGHQLRLFGLPPDEIVYCSVCGKLFHTQ